MSKQTLCNYCRLKVLRKAAKAKKKKVTVLSDTPWGSGGVNIYIHPLEVEINKLENGEDGERAKYRWSWMEKIEDHCTC